MKALSDYLKPTLTPVQKRDQGAAQLIAMLDRLAARGEIEEATP